MVEKMNRNMKMNILHCNYIYVGACVCVYMHVCGCVCVHVCLCVRMSVCACVYGYVSLFVCV